MPSTVIRKYEYDEAAQRLSIWFVPSGRRYDYERVPPEIFSAFRQAFSKGQFFNAHIRDKFAFRQVRGERV